MPLPVIPNGPLRLESLRVPGSCVGQSDRLVTAALSVKDGQFVDAASDATVVDMKGAMAFPTFVDAHVHLDKGHIWPRCPNPDGSFDGAIMSVRRDTAANWSAEDLWARMNFSLRSAYAYGTCAMRTHLDSHPPQDGISWPVFEELRNAWAGRIDLQAACLVACHYATSNAFETTADLVHKAGGVLGMVTYPNPDLDAQIEAFFDAAIARGLSADFHADETLDPEVNTVGALAQTVLDRGFDAPVTVGHLCSLSTMAETEALHTLDLIARAGIHVVSLPMCNLYLQDRHGARTPRNRGTTLIHEMAARGIPVSFASDNTRDPFYAYGDLDMLELMREATRIGHLDHSVVDWTRGFLQTPAAGCGFAEPSLRPGAPADLVICNARSWTELFARPQSDRIVLRRGEVIDRTLPDYSELDALMEKT